MQVYSEELLALRIDRPGSDGYYMVAKSWIDSEECRLYFAHRGPATWAYTGTISLPGYGRREVAALLRDFVT